MSSISFSGLLIPVILQVTTAYSHLCCSKIAETSLAREADAHLAAETDSNRRNGKSRKTVKMLPAPLNWSPSEVGQAPSNPGWSRSIRSR